MASEDNVRIDFENTSKKKLKITQTAADKRGAIIQTLTHDLSKLSVDPAVPHIVQLALRAISDTASRQYDAAYHEYRRDIDAIDFKD
ncbi:MAG: hypothetical protein QM754_18400 [Tepidisphaeraceae bacterium]